MSDALPPIQLQTSEQGSPVVIVAEAAMSAPEALLQAVPQLRQPAYAALLAQLLNHLTQGGDMELIMDPADYKAAYDQRLAREDPDEGPQPGVVRLRNYGTPDFASLKPPAYEGDTLVYYTWHTFFTLPYRATVGASGIPEYKPVPLE